MAIVPAPTAPTAEQSYLTAEYQAQTMQTQQLKMYYQRSFQRFWRDPAVSTAALGTNAVKLFEASAELVALIQISDPSFQPLPIPNKPGTQTPYAVVPNADGSVTVS